jgi:hypothetical protein
MTESDTTSSHSDEHREWQTAMRSLGPIEPDSDRAERIRRNARKAWLEAGANSRGASSSRWGRIYAGLEPYLAAAVVVMYLQWAVRTASAWMH